MQQSNRTRLKMLRIAPIILADFFKEGAVIQKSKIIKGLPDDVEIINCRLNMQGQIEFLIKSSQFPELISGEEIPDFGGITAKQV